MMLHLIIEVLDELGVRREAHNELLREYNGSNCLPTLRMKIGTKDRRKIYMKGFVELENFNTEESMEGSFVCLTRTAASYRVTLFMDTYTCLLNEL